MVFGPKTYVKRFWDPKKSKKLGFGTQKVLNKVLGPKKYVTKFQTQKVSSKFLGPKKFITRFWEPKKSR